MNYTRYSIELINSNPTFEKRTIGDCTLYLGDSLELLAAGVFGKIGLETYRAVFEVLPGKRNRALALLSLVIKTPK